MRRGVIASVLLHGIILALVLFGLPLGQPEPPEVSVIPIEIIPEAELAEVTTPTPEPEPEPEPEPKPEEVEAPPPPPEPAPAPPPPPPAETAEAVPPLEDVEPEVEQKPEVEPEPAPPEPRPTANIQPRTKPEPPSRFDTSRIAALLDKDDRPEPEPQPQQQQALDLEKLAENLGQRNAPTQQQLATLAAMVQDQIYRCWSIPAGIQNAEDQVVRVRILLRPDGSLIGAPEVLNKERYNDPDGAQFDIAARAAVNAIHRCVPLELPRDRYDDWREVIQTFDPSQMLDVN